MVIIQWVHYSAYTGSKMKLVPGNLKHNLGAVFGILNLLKIVERVVIWCWWWTRGKVTSRTKPENKSRNLYLDNFYCLKCIHSLCVMLCLYFYFYLFNKPYFIEPTPSSGSIITCDFYGKNCEFPVYLFSK